MTDHKLRFRFAALIKDTLLDRVYDGEVKTFPLIVIPAKAGMTTDSKTAPGYTMAQSLAVQSAVSACKDIGCSVAGWGQDAITVELKDPQQFENLKSRLASLGFQFQPDEDSQAAGLYDFSLPHSRPSAINPYKDAQTLRLPFMTRYQCVFWAALGVLMLAFSRPQDLANDWRTGFALAILAVGIIFSVRNLLWKIDFDGMRGFYIQSVFSSRHIPWDDISSIKSKSWRGSEYIIFTLKSGATIKTPAMFYPRARAMMDELKRRQAQRELSA